MKALGIGLFVVCLFSQVARAQVPQTMSRLAMESVDAVWRDLGRCGLQQVAAYDPRLPRPQVPADYAVTNRALNLLAYYHEEFFVVQPRIVFKNPNGGMVHSVLYTSEFIAYSTPLAGTVAQANRYYTVNGPHVRYMCGSVTVDYGQFVQCLNQNWIGVITSQLCRYATP